VFRQSHFIPSCAPCPIRQDANTADPDNTSGSNGLHGLAGKVVTIDGVQEVELFATNFTIGDTDPTFLYGVTDVLGDLTA
jgi:hypothetical protein